MKKTFIQIWVLFIFSLSWISLYSMHKDIPEPDLTAHKIIDDTIEVLAKKYHLHPCGIGMKGKFEYLEISFQTRKSLKKDEIRTILLDCKKTFLTHINACEQIRPYLKNYPFTNKNAGIILFIQDENNYDVFHPEICTASFCREGLVYRTESKDDLFNFKETYEETHEEALEKYRRSAQTN